jgi:hypothetical protein
MAILWVAGRTALLLACGAVACAVAVVRGRWIAAALWLAVALFSKEEALTLPFVLAGWIALIGGIPRASAEAEREARSAEAHECSVTCARGWSPAQLKKMLTDCAKWLSLAIPITGLYLIARSETSAMTPATAPPYYRPTFAASVLLENALGYADRAATLSVAGVAISILLFGGVRQLRLQRAELKVLLCGLIWLVGGFGMTIALPVRSSLYAVVPSIGACLAAAALVSALWRMAEDRGRRRALVAAVVLPLVLIPVYRSRMVSVAVADLSSRLVRDLQAATAPLADGATVVIVDDRRARVNVAAAFGALLPDALWLETGRRLNVRIDPGSPARSSGRPCLSPCDLRLALIDGHLVKIGQ